jgi:hypothetical protein
MMEISEFDALIRKLPKKFDHYKVKYELEDGGIVINAVPADIHARAVHAWSTMIEIWGSNYTIEILHESPLEYTGDAGIILGHSSTYFLDYPWSQRGKKSPDSSFTPRDITSPPARIKPNTFGLGPGFMYPTIVYEVAHRNESWRRLKDDARNKAFSRLTSIQVFVGVKIYAHHFRAFWAHRRTNPNYGMYIQQTTTRLDVKLETQEIFRIPAQYIFFGVPANNIPPTPTPTLDLHLEKVRNAIARFM